MHAIVGMEVRDENYDVRLATEACILVPTMYVRPKLAMRDQKLRACATKACYARPKTACVRAVEGQKVFSFF